MMIDDPVWSLIETIYDAAIDDSLWRKVLDRLTKTTESQQACFFVLDRNGRTNFTTFVYQDFDPKGIEEYLAGMALQDPNVQHMIAHPRQQILHEGSIITESEKKRHIYYDWQARWSEVRHRVVGSTSPMPKVQAGIALHRARGKKDFSSEQIDRFGLFFRHVRRALEIGFRLGGVGPAHRAAPDFLERSPTAIVFLDKSGAVILANVAAREFDMAGAIAISNAGLALNRNSDNDRLQRLITNALSTSRKAGLGTGGAMLAPQPPGRRPLSLLVSPLSGQTFATARLRPAACVVIAEVDTEDEMIYGASNSLIDNATIAPAGQYLRLSRREREVLVWTARGKGRAEIAVILSLAEETVKDYLRRATRKLHANNKTHAAAIALTHGLIRL